MQYGRIRLACSIGLLILGCQGCGKDKPSISGPSRVDSLSISGGSTLSAIGQTTQLSAVLALPSGGTRVVTAEATWTSADPSVATVTGVGLVTATGGLGSVNIVATYQTLNATRAVPVVFAVNSLKLTGNLALTHIGETSQLSATVTLPDGSSRDATAVATWRSADPSIASVSSKGLLTTVGFGATDVSASYGAGPDPRGQTQRVNVTPTGTFVVLGIVRNAGRGGVPFFRVADTQSGKSTIANGNGTYSLAGLTGDAQLVFTLDGFEPAQLAVTGNPGDTVKGDISVQPVIRIAAGQKAQTTVMHNDLVYEVGPSERCVSCRLIRVVSPGIGTLRLTFAWDRPAVALTAWAGGQSYPGPTAGPLEIDLSASGGEIVVYVGVSSGEIEDEDVLTLTVTATLLALPYPLTSFHADNK